MMDFIASLFRGAGPRPHPPLDIRLENERLILRMPDIDDWKAWHAMRESSRAHLVPWEPKWPTYALTYGYYCSLLRRQWRDWRSGRGFAFAVFLKTAHRPILVGGVTLGDVQFAAAQKGTIGYWMGQHYTGQGIMTEAVGMVCDFAFYKLKLQRVEANCLPRNAPSIAVLEKNKFEREGLAKEFLQINGKREDHLLWGRVRTAKRS